MSILNSSFKRLISHLRGRYLNHPQFTRFSNSWYLLIDSTSFVKSYSKSTSCIVVNHFRCFSTDEKKIPTNTRVVICGGGVIGTSVAYHLSIQGWTEVVLLEQGSLACGTSWHAAGIVSRLKSSPQEIKLFSYSAKLYKDLTDEGYDVGWKEVGSLMLARNKDRMTKYKRLVALAQPNGLECEMVPLREAKKMNPLVKIDDLEGALWVPGDGVIKPKGLCFTFGKLAEEKGIQIIEECTVLRILTKNNRVNAVETNHGIINCEYFINCAGMWAREVGQRTDCKNIRAPVHPCEHFYLITKPLESPTDFRMPVVRDPDGGIYIREWQGGILAGGFEKIAKPIFHDSIPSRFDFQLLSPDWDHFHGLLEEILHRFPIIGQAEILKLVNGPEGFTPDGKIFFGQTPEVDNYFVASGMSSFGISAAGGVGKVIAEWVVNGQTVDDWWNFDIQRFLDLHNNKKFLRDRVQETVGLTYSLNYPFSEYSTSRNLRTSPLHTTLKASGAVFGQIMGYERPNCFFPKDDDSYLNDNKSVTMLRGSFGKPEWFERVREEYLACREGVALLDMSSFTKFELKSGGREIVDYLQYLCSNDVDIPIGHIIHTGMHNHNGGYENDCSLVRLGENHFFMISPTVQQIRSKKWLKKHLPKDTTITISDLTSMYTAINVIGPLSRTLLSDLTDSSMKSSDFPFFTCQDINVGHASGIRAMNLTHTGELGWVLYIPNEYALHVFECLMSAGRNYHLQLAGTYAMRTLRIERFYAFWGQDLDTTTTPLECGRMFRVKFNKGDFLGKEALLRQKETGVKRLYVQLLLDNHDLHNDPWPWGGEPIYRNGKYCGMTTTTGYGFTLGKHVCLGFVNDFDEATGEKNIIASDFVLKENTHFEVDIAGKRFPAKVSIHSPKLPMATELAGQLYMATRGVGAA